MAGFIIRGGKKLNGEIRVSGSKNAALPIIFSSIAIPGKSCLSGVPYISDVDIALDILRSMGAVIYRSDGELIINTETLEYSEPPMTTVSRIRASSYLIGACLSRFGRAKIQRFGGCNFDARPIDMHLYAAEKFGARIENDEIFCKRLHGADLYFDKVSVGATINAIIMATSAVGDSRIYGYAREPHVIALVDFLNSAGADINLRDDCVYVSGRSLTSATAKIIPDMIEAGTYVALSLITDSDISVLNADADHLFSFLNSLKDGGAEIYLTSDKLAVGGSISRPLAVSTAPYPAFPTDLQPIVAPLMAAACGGVISEGIFASRFGYLNELSKFGVEYRLGGASAEIFKSTIRPARATVPDLRGGAALVLAALSAEGESIIENADLIKRGYDNVVKKLRQIGADVTEI